MRTKTVTKRRTTANQFIYQEFNSKTHYYNDAYAVCVEPDCALCRMWRRWRHIEFLVGIWHIQKGINHAKPIVMAVAQSITLESALEIPSNYCRLNE